MFKICLAITRFNISKIQSSLKVLSLQIPTNKKEIKTKYLEMAKKLHPDVKDQKANSLSPEMIQKKNQAFIQITKAYKLLNQLSENQINNPKQDDQQEYFDKNQTHYAQNARQQTSKPLSPEQRIRKETYAYFNRRYKKQQQQQYEQQKKQPLYRQLPQLFLGMMFVAAFIIEWGYTAMKRSALNINKNNKEEHIEAIQGMNFKKRYDRHTN